MAKTLLIQKLEEVIAKEIHKRKSNAHKLIPKEAWQAIDSKDIADSCMNELREIIESWAYIPCCHITGMHDPTHFNERKYICPDQKAEAYERLCKELQINPETKSKPDCYWCKTHPHYRKGEGMKLFTEE